MPESQRYTSDSVRQYYDAVSSEYDAQRFTTRYRSYIAQLDQAFVYSQSIPGKALEIGPGTGRITRTLIRRGLEVSVVDTSDEMLRLVHLALPQVTIYRLSAHNLDRLPGFGSYDNVVACRVLPHITDIPSTLDLMRRATKPGGRVIFDLWNSLGYVAISRMLRVKRSAVFTDFQTPIKMARMIANAGLRVDRRRGIGFGPFPSQVLEALGHTLIGLFAHIQIFACTRIR